jgi:hypothetical protein
MKRRSWGDQTQWAASTRDELTNKLSVNIENKIEALKQGILVSVRLVIAC